MSINIFPKGDYEHWDESPVLWGVEITDYGVTEKPEITIFLDISSLQEALSKKNYGGIIDSPELFWMAFCATSHKVEVNSGFSGSSNPIFIEDGSFQKRCAPQLYEKLPFCKVYNQYKSPERRSLKISLENTNLNIYGTETTYSKLKDCVEQIRRLFVKAKQEKCNFFILPVRELGHRLHHYIKPDPEFLTLDDRDFCVNTTAFNLDILPCMQGLSVSVGAICDNTNIPELVYEVNAFRIKWTSKRALFTLKTIPQRDLTSQQQPDLSLKADDGTCVKVHSQFLREYGGEVMQQMLDSKMKESETKEVHFPEYSLDAVQAFVDFIYKGENGVNVGSHCLGELFQLAHTYQVPSLIDHCVNLLILSSAPEDRGTIKDLIDIYGDERLKELHLYLGNFPSGLQTNGDSGGVGLAVADGDENAQVSELFLERV